MATLALVLTLAWIALVSGVPTYLQVRRGGGVRTLARPRPGSAQWWARLISALGFMLAFAAPVAELAGLPPLGPLDRTDLRLVGVGLVVLGTVISLTSQVAMGASWRGDVDPDARTELVTSGPFRIVRNPIITGVLTTAVGLALMVPNILAVVMLVAILTALQIQIRLVEEPYLLQVHGDAYRRYAARTGRFLPWIGRLR